MPYSALPGHRMPYDEDGTLVYHQLENGALASQNSATLAEWNDNDYVAAGPSLDNGSGWHTHFFFPEKRHVVGLNVESGERSSARTITSIAASNDTVSGYDGTWETGTWPAGAIPAPEGTAASDYWRTGIRAVSFTQSFRVVRLRWSSTQGGTSSQAYLIHMYGHKGSGETLHDLIFIDHDTTPGTEFALPEMWEGLLIGQVETRQFRIKNTSASKTATNVTVTVDQTPTGSTTGLNISSDGSTWVSTNINIGSLAPGAESATLHSRYSAIGGIGPKTGKLEVTCDSGFFE